VFDFFSSARNLERITPPWLGFRVVTPGEIPMGVGTVIDYRLRVKGLPMRWRSLIAVWEPPFAFEDVMLAGPYRSWEHRHEFEAVAGGTLLRDRVRWSLPLGPLGGLAAPFVRRDLVRIFEHRRAAVAAAFG
jgi:ligand-binding SRPBCC domain-containing protein